jgi:hypothetical protein
MRRFWVFVALAVTVGSLAAPAGAAPGQTDRPRITITVVSSQPEHVTGGDALVGIRVPRLVELDEVTVTVDGVDVTDAFAPGE